MTSVLATVLTGYLALVGFIADGVQTAWHFTEKAPVVLEQAVSTSLEPLLEGPSSLANTYTSLLDLLQRSLDPDATSTAATSVAGNSVVETTVIETNNVITSNEQADTNLADAIVNIYCTHTKDKAKRYISGTGFFINNKGVLMTNAHVAQFLLLEQLPAYGEVDCLVRTGEAAAPAYEVELLYISPTWILKHAELINDNEPRGTGENDFAILYATKRADGVELPANLPYLPVDTDYLETTIKNQMVIVVGYPKEEGVSTKNARRQIATTTVPNLFTFGSSYADIITLAGSAIGAQGASGGPVVGAEGKVIGMISTRANDEKYGEGSLAAITTSYIHRTLIAETGYGLSETIVGDLDNRAKIFGETMSPILTGLLADQL